MEPHRVAAAHQWRGLAGAPFAGYVPPVIWPPPLTCRETRRLAARVLSGARFRRRLHWRYSLIWAKPSGPG